MARTAGERAGWAVLAALALTAALQPIACGGGSGPGPGDVEAGALLAAVGPSVVTPTLDEMAARVGALRGALDAWRDAIDAGDTEAIDGAHAAARAAWWAAMATWQRAEVMQIGPAAPAATAVAGADLRDPIYSWPTINPCRVDQETARARFADPGYFDAALVNVRGLDALEHLLYAGPANACPPQVDINADGTWAALGAVGVRALRAEHAAALAGQLDADVDRLRDAWAPTGGDFSALLALAGEPASPYSGRQQALNAVYDALFYLETRTKDRKIALPLGVRDCTGAACAEQVESAPSGASIAWIEANLHGFSELFHGGGDTGMADLLVTLGHGALVERIDRNLDAAIAAAAAHDGRLDDLIREDRAAAQALHDAIKLLTDDVKGDLATVLALQIPSEAAGDND
jgi:uncharacterized protein